MLVLIYKNNLDHLLKYTYYKLFLSNGMTYIRTIHPIHNKIYRYLSIDEHSRMG